MSLPSLSRRFRKSELGGLAGDASYVAVWQGAGVIAELVQIALVTHALGLAEYGRLALVIAFVMLVGGFFNVRIGIAATTHGARPLAQGAYRAAASVFRLAYMIDFGTVACALVVLAALAPLLGPSLIGEGATALVLLYSVTLVAQALETTSINVLRLLDRFRSVAVNRVFTELARIALLVAALAIDANLLLVVAAVAVAKLGGGFANLATASRAFERAGNGWRLTDRAGPMAADDRKAMLGTVFHTNLIAYARVAQVQLPTLMLGAMAGPTQTALYKVGMAVASGLTKVVDPATAALLPRFSRLWAAGKKAELSRLVRQATLICVPLIVLAFGLLVLFRDPLLRLLGTEVAATGAGTVLILGAVGHVFHAAVFWRTALLYAVGRARIISAVMVPVTALQIAGVALLVPEHGANGAALAFLVSLVLSAVALSVAALRALDVEEPPRTAALVGTASR